MTGLFVIAMIIPVFLFRHYVTDKGQFPERMLEDLQVGGNTDVTTCKAGIWPYVTLVAGVATVVIANQIFG
jgi:hypothetical protein